MKVDELSMHVIDEIEQAISGKRELLEFNIHLSVHSALNILPFFFNSLFYLFPRR